MGVEKNTDKITNINARRTGRIEWMDGLKGIACFQVFFNHFMCSIYPAYYMSGEQPVHTNGFEKWLAYSPLNLLLEGEMFVAIFCIISGFLLASKVMKMKKEFSRLSDVIVGRYFRLMLPVAPIGVLVWLMTRFGWFTNVAASNITGSEWLGSFYSRPMGIAEMLASVLIKTWFYGDDLLSTAFWMLSQLFIGSLIVILLGCVYWKMPKKSIAIYLFVALALIPRHDYVVAFVFGAIFAWLVTEDYINIFRKIDSSGKLSTLIGVIAFALGIFVAGYPIQLEPRGIYVYLNCGFNDMWRIAGAVLVMYGVWNVELFQRILSGKILNRLGAICYEFYIIHIPLLFSVGTGLFMILNNISGSYNVAGIISFFIIFGIVIVAAKLYSMYVSKWCAAVERKILGYFSS